MANLKTEQESLVFVKRMMAVAVSSITYLRGIFPESAYRSRYLEGEEKSVSGVVSHIMRLTRDIYLFFGYSVFNFTRPVRQSFTGRLSRLWCQ